MKSTLSEARVGLAWEAPRLEYKGTVGEILQSGGGKLSLTAAGSGRESLRETARRQVRRRRPVRDAVASGAAGRHWMQLA